MIKDKLKLSIVLDWQLEQDKKANPSGPLFRTSGLKQDKKGKLKRSVV